jgi:hypothetical protein
MSRRSRNLSLTAVVVFGMGMAAFNLVGRSESLGGSGPGVPPGSAPIETPNRVPGSPEPDGEHPSPPEVARARTYALSSAELEGLPPELAAGTVVQLWVAWEPPVTTRIRFQKLLSRVTIQRVLPGLTPREPETILVGLEPSQVSDLLYGDRYGSLSAVILSTPAAP